MKCINADRLNYLGTNEPTYCPTDANKLPDLLDFFTTENISPRHIQIDSSDHSPVIATINSTIMENCWNTTILHTWTQIMLHGQLHRHLNRTLTQVILATVQRVEFKFCKGHESLPTVSLRVTGQL